MLSHMTTRRRFRLATCLLVTLSLPIHCVFPPCPHAHMPVSTCRTCFASFFADQSLMGN